MQNRVDHHQSKHHQNARTHVMSFLISPLGFIIQRLRVYLGLFDSVTRIGLVSVGRDITAIFHFTTKIYQRIANKPNRYGTVLI